MVVDGIDLLLILLFNNVSVRSSCIITGLTSVVLYVRSKAPHSSPTTATSLLSEQ